MSETSKFGFYSSRTDGKRVHRSVGLHGAELWPFEAIRLLEESYETLYKEAANVYFLLRVSIKTTTIILLRVLLYYERCSTND